MSESEGSTNRELASIILKKSSGKGFCSVMGAGSVEGRHEIVIKIIIAPHSTVKQAFA